MCVSTGASVSMESIANEHRRYIKEKYPQSYSQLWFQIYVTKNRNFSKNLIERAERCGYKALVLTVDTCAIGNRECDIHNNFSLPDGIRAENFIDENNIIAKTYRQLQIDPSLSWKDLDWIRSITSLPLILKGIMHPDDARKAVRYGVQGIIVSNHGGRQLDTCQNRLCDPRLSATASWNNKTTLMEVLEIIVDALDNPKAEEKPVNTGVHAQQSGIRKEGNGNDPDERITSIIK
ncbi:unnamed protein product [Rotaria sp. Silwood1]|nr:unnamed protein product [Rotaria sp. Silwood1]